MRVMRKSSNSVSNVLEFRASARALVAVGPGKRWAPSEDTALENRAVLAFDAKRDERAQAAVLRRVAPWGR